MAEEFKSHPQGIAAVSVTDFIEWLDSRRGGENNCPICKFDGWHIIANGDAASTAALVRFPMDIGTMSWGKPLFQMECRKCAYLATFVAATIHDWVAAGKPMFKDDRIDA